MLTRAVLAIFVLGHNRFGRLLYALGGNEDTARLWGVSLLGVSSFYQLIIKGLIISLAVWFDVLQKKNRAG